MEQRNGISYQYHECIVGPITTHVRKLFPSILSSRIQSSVYEVSG